MQWPGYATAAIPAKINGVDVIIQPWMGLCEEFMGRSNFPGGVGGEVAVYVKVPFGKQPPDASVLPGPMKVLAGILNGVGLGDLWWPDPNVQPTIDFTLINPLNNQVLLRAAQETNYWVNKWMQPASYALYKQANPVPAIPPSTRWC